MLIKKFIENPNKSRLASGESCKKSKMKSSPGKVCRLSFIRIIGNKLSLSASRYRILFGLFIAVSLVYKITPAGSRKLPSKTPWTAVRWHDADFRPDGGKNELIILKWTTWWAQSFYVKVLTSKECPYVKPSKKAGSGQVFHIPCRLTYDRRYLNASHALVFHSYDLKRDEIPKIRSTERLWIYDQLECPKLTTTDLRNYRNIFNWTMTYRRDSDVYNPYFQVVPLPIGIGSNSTVKTHLNLGKRPNLVAWIVSHCDTPSKREYFVKELQNHIPVSVYGWCGQGQDCPTTTQRECYAHVGKTHKFYLSLENSLCKDYITEKFLFPLMSNLVPVVYGGTSLEDYSAIAPPGSYIDARNFTSAKHLAEYLVHLDGNEEEYMKYFEWKSKYQVIENQAGCDLCQRVFEHSQLTPESSSVPSERKRSYKWYNDLWTWWNYVDHDPALEQEKPSRTSQLDIIGPSYKLAAPACQSPIKNLTGSMTKLFDFEPWLLSKKRVSKWHRNIKNAVVGW